jgi:DNA-binding SARP family transcriptional activator
MKLHEIIHQHYEVLLNEIENSQVVLLHPQTTYRSMLIAQLVKDPDVKTFYYALGWDDIDVPSFIYSLIHDLAPQHPTFGRHLTFISNGVYEDLNNNMPIIIDAFVRELREMGDQRFVLILDEYDRSDEADDVQRFVERLAIALPENCHLVINSRSLPRLSWVSLIAQNKATMLLNDQMIVKDFYGFENDDTGNLEVYALGPGFVLLNNDYIDSWEGHLPRLLFFFALDRPVVTRSDICSSFWPNLHDEQAVNVFHVTKRRLHKALDADVLVHNDGYYRVNPQLNIYYDVLDFAASLIRGRDMNNPNRLEDYQRAASLYRGPFLQGHEDNWIVQRRVDFRAGYVEALTYIANSWKERNNLEQALTVLQKGLTEDLRVDGLSADVMRLYSDLGRRNEAAAHYQRVLQDYSKDNLKPSEKLTEVYQELMA